MKMVETNQIVALRGILEVKAQQSDITASFIREVLSESCQMVGIIPDSADFEEVARILETQFDIQQDLGHSISADNFNKWWADRRSGGIDLHYWNRLNQYLLHQGDLPSRVINVLNQTTDEILDYAGDPMQTKNWSRRGMVIGHVQSGKTSNYAALICKAADAGYKVIILLAGITNSLRKQTQERIDHAFIGKHATELQNVRQEVIGAALHVNEGLPKHPDYGTTQSRDFNLAAAMAQAGHQMQNKTEPIIFVCKKNVSTLKNLNKYFENVLDRGINSLPLLLIDDEADNATINTSASATTITAINKNIRLLLSKFTKSSYVGYTATPFANIFIDPSSKDEMENDDLFPSDFIKSLDPPSNYVGPDRLFGKNADLSEVMLVKINDHDTILPTKHKVDHIVESLPRSLLEAIKAFIISKALRIHRGDAKKHSTMMVNVSKFNKIQEQLEGLIYEYLNKLKGDFFLNSARPSSKSTLLMAEVEKVFRAEFHKKIKNCPDWDDLKKYLYQASADVDVRQINQTGRALDYDNYGEDGLSVIAIGGLALSRGLTLEGLTVSYVLRNAAASDTLMQMGRWFGYRSNYEDLCRLYLPKESIDFYQEVTESVSELREEVKLMEEYGATPSEFGLKVRESPAAIRITAANKMRSAELITLSVGYAGKTIEGHSLRPNIDNSENLSHLKRFIFSLGSPKPSEDIISTDLFWSAISKKTVLEFIQGFKLAPSSKELFVRSNDTNSLASDYIMWANSDFKEWDVSVNNPLSEAEDQTSISLNEWYIKPRLRHAGEWVNKGVYKITKNRRVGSGGDAATGLLKTTKTELDNSGSSISDSLYNSKRNEDRPLLMIYLMDCKGTNLKGKEQALGSVVTYSISFPGRVTDRQIKRDYQANVVYQQLEMDLGYGGLDDSEEIESLINE